jgi:hypothetical protein
MALQSTDKRCFRSEQNGHCIQQVTDVPGIFAHVFADKVPALLARKSRVPSLCDLGVGFPELGFVSMTELRALRGPLGLPVERDEHFDADKPLSAYANEAREHGRIVT